MGLSKKHFKAIAEILNDHRKEVYSEIATNQNFENLCEAISLFCWRENGRFDKARFLDACHGLPFRK